MTLNITDITSPPSFRPVADAIKYTVKDKNGYEIEFMDHDLSVFNTETAYINPATSGVNPDYWENYILANYTIAWSFLNFE